MTNRLNRPQKNVLSMKKKRLFSFLGLLNKTVGRERGEQKEEVFGFVLFFYKKNIFRVDKSLG